MELAVERISNGESITVVSWLRRLFVGVPCLILGAGMVARSIDGSAQGSWATAVIGLGVLGLSFRAVRGASVQFRANEVVIRQTWRTRRIPRNEIIDIGITRSASRFVNRRGTHPLGWRVPYFWPERGTRLWVKEIRSVRTGTVVDRLVEIGRLWASVPDREGESF